jgi:cardiolipin synthase
MLLDPIADKLLLVSSFLILTAKVAEGTTRIPLWLTITVVSRDVLLVIAVIITNLALGKHVFPPSIWGKLTTAFQLLTVLAVLFSNALRLELPFLQPLFFVTLALTVISTLHYLFSRGMKLSDYQE